MNDKMFSRLAGTFSILNTIQFLILDLNEVVFLGYEDKFDIYMDIKYGIASWILTNKKNISISLSTITIIVSSLLLYCIHVNKYMGLLCYAIWIATYELTSFSMVLLTNGIIKEQFKELGYLHLIFQISRMFLHFSCLPFIIKYTYTLYKDPKTLSKISRRRHSSISTVDSWPSVGPGMMYRKIN
ncbi:putative transmembrane protein 217B [Pteronotus mesoamericanus]|uniref:putative transmembrane protein 217B n=1 Tax=Pteronotus mesoamericanus TaxID=1884717 RepID=UPI0023EDE7D2|nr:putative transmembrane protein 217B [Pteronotus parnellii mesoamericanus]